jgi:hypothetical protein
LSLAALEKRLHLRKWAREDAARGQPAVDAHGLSDAETTILDVASRERANIDDARASLGSAVERQLRALAPAPQDFSAPLIDAKLSLRQIAGRVARECADANARAAQAKADLEAFKQANELRRAAVYPESGLLQAGMLLLAAVFESLFSAALFAEDDARGLLGGAITAIGLSGANVTLGYLAGYLGLRYMQHVKAPIKALGAAGFAGFALLALMLNLFAADWRDQMAAQAGAQPDRGADASFHIWSVLQVQSPQAIILLMLGAGVWVFSTMRGYSAFDDPYPDYGKMDRAAREAAGDAADLADDAREQLEEPIDEAKAALTQRLDAVRRGVAAMSQAFDAGAARMHEFDAQARAIDDVAVQAIRLYRQENEAARTGPAPDYFAAPPSPPRSVSDDPLAQGAALIDEARGRLASAQAESAQASEALLNALEESAALLGPGAAS